MQFLVSQLHFLTNRNAELAIPPLFWPVNCRKIWGHLALLSDLTVYSLCCDWVLSQLNACIVHILRVNVLYSCLTFETLHYPWIPSFNCRKKAQKAMKQGMLNSKEIKSNFNLEMVNLNMGFTSY